MNLEIEHRDKLGRLLKKGDCVAVPQQNKLMIGIITKLNNKMIRIEKIGAKRRWEPIGVNKYAVDSIKLEGPDVTMYILKESGG